MLGEDGGKAGDRRQKTVGRKQKIAFQLLSPVFCLLLLTMANDSRKLSELTIGDAKRILVYGVVLIVAVALFARLTGRLIITILLGVVVAAYLLPVQRWLESRLRRREGSALVTMALILLPLIALTGYIAYELSAYSGLTPAQRENVMQRLSSALAQYLPIARSSTRAGLETAFAAVFAQSVEAAQSLRRDAPLLLASLSLFFFTIYYVLTQRTRLIGWIKVRVPGNYLPLYEKLSENIGGALRGALRAVFIDQALKCAVILTLNLIFGVPLAASLAAITFLLGFFPLMGEWMIYIPVSIYLLVFAHAPVSALIYLLVGVALTISSSLLIRPRLASSGTQHFNFYWMLVALVAGVYSFGIPGIVLGPAILGFARAVIETFVGQVNYADSLLVTEFQKEMAEGANEELEPPPPAEQTVNAVP